MNSSVDVIIPCYRYGRFLRQCVESVLAQDIQHLRILVIDDASPDNTSEVAEALASEHPSVTYVRHSTNRGHIATYNEGIEWAAADYMLILSADDYLLPGALKRATSLMDTNPEVGFTFGRAIRLDVTTGLSTTVPGAGHRNGWRIFKGLEFIIRNGTSNIVPTPTAVVRTKLQQRLGGYRPELPHSGDMEMWLRFAAHASVAMSAQPEAVYRRHSENMSLSYAGENWLPEMQQRKAALDCFFEACHGVLAQPERLRKELVRKLASDVIGLASVAFNEGRHEVCTQLLQFASSVCPNANESWPWRKLACKKKIGLVGWRAVRPVVNGIGQMASFFRFP